MERAKQRYVEHYRGTVLSEEATNWKLAEEIRAYCAAAESTYPDSDETIRWVIWARRYANSIDPLREPPRTPDVPESARVEDLKPFLDGWSPYGPDRDRW